MQRTQIYLDREILETLAILAAKSGKTRSDLIRQALYREYSNPKINHTLAKVANSSDIFKDLTLTNSQRQWS